MKLTIKEIAEIAGVSQSTVSKIINNYDGVALRTREKVKVIIEENRYRPSYSAKTLAGNLTNFIGVIYAGKVNAGFNHPFFVDVINTFKKTIGPMGYDLIFFSNELFHQEKEDYLARCNHYQVDGCIVISGEEVEPSIFEIDKSEIPCVGIDLQLFGDSSTYVMTDNEQISIAAVEHLYHNGYQKIAFIGGHHTSLISRLRLESFMETMNKYGLDVREEWVLEGDFFEGSGYQRMMDLLEGKQIPEAVFASSDLMALGVMKAISDKGLNVDDFAVIGVDDILAAQYVKPSLSSIRQDQMLIGKIAAEMLNDLIVHNHRRNPVLIEPTLVARHSTKRKITSV
ncbi:LacI family DNA-binding transcriptional regulator [Evansella halocellulosilytica]|uniref:LacI family DNA-binding transcriptional regulator n=1 Tax=Evansella halocellulosilytica TaxID=2011013 RepID=UPI000BB699B2|nr:LacI family DNA-binding transcriptional regulator [Evansella halocellulosilytica]